MLFLSDLMRLRLFNPEFGWWGDCVFIFTGEFGDFNTAVLRSSFYGICPSSRSINSFHLHDFDHAYCQKTFSIFSEITGLLAKISVKKIVLFCF